MNRRAEVVAMTPTETVYAELAVAVQELREYGDMLAGLISVLPAECRQDEDQAACVLHDAEWSTRNGDDLGHCEWIEARMEAIPGWKAAERRVAEATR